MKKFLTMILYIATLSAILVGCGAPVGEEDGNNKGSNAEALKIAIVSSPSGVDDGSFNQNIYNGILGFVEVNPEATVAAIKEESGAPQAVVQAVADIVADYNVIVCCGFQFTGITSIAEENPDVDFILVDSFPSDADGNKVTVDNIYAMTFKEQESGFAAGLAAALETKTEKVAVVNGIAYPANVNYQYGFESGVNYANKHLGTKAEIIEISSYAGQDAEGNNIGGNYVGDFDDEATGKMLGETLISKGVDIIFVAAGASGNGVFTAAKETEGVYCIGCDVDQYDDGANGKNNIVLTSALKIMDKNVRLQLEKVKSGTFQGENALLGYDTDSTGYVSENGRCQLSEETIREIGETLEKVKMGHIVPASSNNKLSPENFIGL